MHPGRNTYTGQKGTAAGAASGKFITNTTHPNAKLSASTSKLASADFKKGMDPTPRQMWRAQPKPLVPLDDTAHELLYGPRKEVRIGGKMMVPPPPPPFSPEGLLSSSSPADSFAKDTYARLVFSPLPGAAAPTGKGGGGGGEHEEIYIGDAKMEELLSRASAGGPSGYSSSRGPAAALASRGHGPQLGGLDLGLSGADYNSTLTGTTSRRPDAQKPLPLSSAAAPSAGQPSVGDAALGSLQTDNLNTTIGRADRAAMLLGLELKNERPTSSGGRHHLATGVRTEAAPTELRREDSSSSAKNKFTGTGTQNLMFSNASEIENLKALLQAAAEDEGSIRPPFSDNAPQQTKANQSILNPSLRSPKSVKQSNGRPASLSYTNANNANTTWSRAFSPDVSAGGPTNGGGSGTAVADAANANVYATPRLQAALAKLYANTPAPTAAIPPAKDSGRSPPSNANAPGKVGTEWYLRTESSTASLRYDVLTVDTIRVRFGDDATLMRTPDLFDVISYVSIRSSAVASVFAEKEDASVPPPLDGLRRSNPAQGKNGGAAGNKTATAGNHVKRNTTAATSSKRSAAASYASLLNTPATVLASLAAAPSNPAPSGSPAGPVSTAASSTIFREGGAAGDYKSGTDVLRDAVVANTKHLQTFICLRPEEERLHNKVAQWCDRCVLEEEEIVDEATGNVYSMYKADPDVQHEAAMLEVIRDEEEVRSRKLLTRRRLDQQSRARRESVVNAVSRNRSLDDNERTLFNGSYGNNNNNNNNSIADHFVAVGSRTERPSVLGTTTLTVDAQKSLAVLRQGAAVQPHNELVSYFNPFDVEDEEDIEDSCDEVVDERRTTGAYKGPSALPPSLGVRSLAAGAPGRGLASPLALPGVLPPSNGDDTAAAAASLENSAAGEAPAMGEVVALTAAEKYLLELVVLSIIPCCPLDSLVRAQQQQQQQHPPDFLGPSATDATENKREENTNSKKCVGVCYYLEQPASFTRDLTLLREINMKLYQEEVAAMTAPLSTSGSVRAEASREPHEVVQARVLPLHLYFCAEGDHLFHAHSLSADAVVEVRIDAMELLLLMPGQTLTALYHSAFNGHGKGNQSRSKKRASSVYGNGSHREELLFFSAASAPVSCQLAWREALQSALLRRGGKATPSAAVGYALDSFSVDIGAAVAESRQRVVALKKGADTFLRHLKQTIKNTSISRSASLLGDHVNASSVRSPLCFRSPQQSPFSQPTSSASSPPLPSSGPSLTDKRKSHAAANDWGAETGWEEIEEGGPPMVGHTPVIPGKRELYGCDMQNLYLLATLAAEEMQQVLGPRLQRVREQYHEQLVAMGESDAAVAAVVGNGDGGGGGGASAAAGNPGKRRTVVFNTTAYTAGKGNAEGAAAASAAASTTAMPRTQSIAPGRGNQSLAAGKSDVSVGTAAGETKLLSKALDDWRSVFALYETEVEYARGLFALYVDEAKINEYNMQVPSFNEFQERQKKIWGPLYRSALRISYVLCKFLSVYGLKNLPEDCVYLLHPVAMFVGCTGGHREMRVKLPEVLLEVIERAKRVRLPVESIPLKEKGEMILQEASAAVAAQHGNASDVVTCLATEADVLRLALQFVPVPATCALSIPSLDSALPSSSSS